MNNFLDEYSMRQASIFELRNIAREMGVNSPTIYKKEVLIEKILKIMNGEEKPQMPKSRQGRPPKNLNSHKIVNQNSENIVSYKDLISSQQSVENEERSYNFESYGISNKYNLACPGFVYGEDSSKDNDNPFKFEKEQGYYYLVENKYGFIFEPGRTVDVDKVIFVPENYANAYNVRSGDLIGCSSKTIVSTNTKYLSSIESVNGNTEIRPERNLFEEMPISFSNKSIEGLDSTYLSKFSSKIKFGTRNVLLVPNLREYLNLLDSFKNVNNDCVVVNLCLEALPEDVCVFNKYNNFENFYTFLGDSEKQNNITINIAISRVKRLAELNKNVIFIVNELKKAVKHQNFLLGNMAEDFKQQSLNYCYDFMTLSRSFELGNSVTVFALLKDENNSTIVSSLKNELDNMNCDFYKL